MTQANISTPPFVGRAAELKWLAKRLTAARQDRIQLALVAGSSGSGASALASAFSKHAEQLGFLCFHGHCSKGQSIPFEVWNHLIDGTSRKLTQGSPARLQGLSRNIDAIAPLFPILEQHSATGDGEEGDESASQPPHERRLLAFEGVAGLLQKLQTKTPLLFVLDDLHWADGESVELLMALLRRVEGRVMFLGIYHAEKVASGHPLQRISGAKPRFEGLHGLKLGPMGSADIASLMGAAGHGSVDADTLEIFAERAGGSPFFALEIARMLARDGAQGVSAEALTVDDLIWGRFERLSPLAYRILTLVAAAGVECPRGVLSRACGLDGAVFDETLDELIDGGLLKSVSAAGDVPDALNYALTHEQYRDAAYINLDAQTRRDRHRALAEAIQRRPEDQPHPDEALMRHWAGAGEPGKGFEHALRFAAVAADKLAFGHAIDLTTEVLTSEDGQALFFQSPKNWERLGALCEIVGKLGEAVRAYREALLLLQTQGLEPPKADLLRVRGRLGAALIAFGRADEGLATYNRAMDDIGLELDRSRFRLAVITRWLRLRIFVASRLPARWVRRVPADLDREKIAFFDTLGLLMASQWPLRGVEAMLRCELLCRRFDNKAILHKHIALGTGLRTFGRTLSDPERARETRRLDDAMAEATDHHVPMAREHDLIGRGCVGLGEDLAASTAHFKQATTSLRRKGMLGTGSGIFALLFTATTLSAQGNNTALFNLYRRLLHEQPQNHMLATFMRNTVAVTWLRRGRLDKAQALMDEITSTRETETPFGLHDLFMALNSFQAGILDGRGSRILTDMAVLEPRFEAIGAFEFGPARSRWIATGLQAALGCHASGQLADGLKKSALRNANWLIQNGIMGTDVLGHRALALFAHGDGKPQEALGHIRAALDLLPTCIDTHNQYLCLTAAREIGALDEAGARRAKALAARLGIGKKR